MNAKYEIKIGRRSPNRNRQNPSRTAKSGFVLIVVDTNETEKNYFSGLKNSLSNSGQITIKRAKKTEKIVEFALDYVEKQGLPLAEVWLVFDRDEVGCFDEIIAHATRKRLKVGWSNPCFEIWLHAYFGKMPTSADSQRCVRQFKESFKKICGKEYVKNDPEIYSILERYGSCREALRLADQKYAEALGVHADNSLPSQLSPACTVHHLVRRLKAADSE